MPTVVSAYVLSDYVPGSYLQAWVPSLSKAGEAGGRIQWGGSGQSLRLGGEVQILASGFFPLRLLMVQFHLPLYFLLFQKSKPILCPSLSALVVYLKAVTFYSFTHSREHYRFYETSSFSEAKAKSLIKEAGQDQEGGTWKELGWVRVRSDGQADESQEDEGAKEGWWSQGTPQTGYGDGSINSGLKALGVRQVWEMVCMEER